MKDLSTEGGEGLSLVKGVQMTLKAIALSIKPGGALDELHVGGSISTSGDDVVSVELADRVGSWDVLGGIRAKGNGSDGVHYTGDGPRPLVSPSQPNRATTRSRSRQPRSTTGITPRPCRHVRAAIRVRRDIRICLPARASRRRSRLLTMRAMRSERLIVE